MQIVYAFLCIGTPRTVLFQGGGDCNIPSFDPGCIKRYMMYMFAINRGVELKEKSPPSIWLCYVLAIGIVTDGISCYPTHYSFGFM